MRLDFKPNPKPTEREPIRATGGMDQDGFRKLLATPRTSSNDKQSNFADGKLSRTSLLGNATPRGMPMTPRNIKDYKNPFKQAQQKESAFEFKVPKKPAKSLLPEGYIDRVKQRLTAAEDDGQQRIESLREMLLKKEISQEQYIEQTQQLGGDMESSALVRGLDRKLLEKVRAGQNVVDNSVEVDGAIAEQLLEETLEHAIINREPKKGRNDLLSDLKRKRTQEQAEEKLKQKKFTPIGNQNQTVEYLEKDGMKLKIIRNAQGTIIKRLVKKLKPAEEIPTQKQQADSTNTTFPSLNSSDGRTTMPENTIEATPVVQNSDIFEDAGEYNPFLEAEEESTEDGLKLKTIDTKHKQKLATKRNYFSTTSRRRTLDQETEQEPHVPSSAAQFLEQNKHALLRASKILDRQTADEQKLVPNKKEVDAGFGLKLNPDAYSADFVEVPEDDEIVQEKGRKRGRKKKAAETEGEVTGSSGKNVE